MSGMFYKSNFNQDISNWDVFNVRDMTVMFYDSKFNQNISNWNIHPYCKASKIFNMFQIKNSYKPLKLQNIDESLNFDDFSEDDLKINKKSLSSIIKDSNHDNNIPYYQDLINLIMSQDIITKKDIKQCIDLYKEYGVLYNPHLDGDDFRIFIKNIIKNYGYKVNLNWIDTSEVTNMNNLFYDPLFNGDISEWDVSNVTNMSRMFSDSYFNGDISNWDVSNVKDMSFMFYNSGFFNQDISKWDVSNVKTMQSMFIRTRFNQDISNWDVSNVENMSNMFFLSSFNSNISNWDVSNVKDMRHMFAESYFNKDISEWQINSYCLFEDIFRSSDITKDNIPRCLRNFINFL